MKYTLILGLEYKKFKRPATITVHIGNTFVDTFALERDYPLKKTTVSFSDTERDRLYEPSKSFDSQWILDELSDREIDLPTFYKIYEIDEKYVEGAINIKVENSNSDYTNGFMKNSSWMTFTLVGLIPSRLLQDNGTKFIEAIARLKRVEAKYCNRLGLKSTPVWVKNSPEGIQEKLLVIADKLDEDHWTYPKNHKWTYHRSRHNWPLAGLFLVRRENEKHEKDAVRHSRWRIGGNFTAEFPIRQKHRTRYIGSWARREVGLVYFADWYDLPVAGKFLINICNEDQ